MAFGPSDFFGFAGHLVLSRETPIWAHLQPHMKLPQRDFQIIWCVSSETPVWPHHQSHMKFAQTDLRIIWCSHMRLPFGTATSLT
ncbi:TPA: hypothetical protein L6B52_09485 [Pseudomonas aeruginosa]|nr:hypothetical protein [Pseudomonas aeruginosa]